MSIALSTRVFGHDVTPEAVLEHLRRLDLRGVMLHRPVRRPAPWREVLRGAAVRCVGVQTPTTPAERFAAGGSCAAILGGATLVIRAPELPAGSDREVMVGELARSLHGPLTAGLPVAVTPGDAGPALLDAEALGWLLEDLPGLGVWLDPVAVMRREAAGEGLGLVALLDRWAGRCRGTFVAGLGSDGSGGRHPEDVGADWSTLGELLPRGVPWVLDLDAKAVGDELDDAVRFLRWAAPS